MDMSEHLLTDTEDPLSSEHRLTDTEEEQLSLHESVAMASSSSDTEDEVSTVTATATTAEADETHPWPYLAKMFGYVGKEDSSYSYRMKCLLCLPLNKELLAFSNSPSNLKVHIKRRHANHVEEYDALTSAKRKRVAPSTSSSLKQTTLVNSRSMMSQSSVEKAIVKFVVEGLQPFSIVEKPAFKQFVTDLQPNSKIISRPTLRLRIDDSAKKMKRAVIEAMQAVDYIATTTDCWSARRRSFIGVTAHWVDPESLTRISAALACRRLRGSHTFDVLANALNDIHSEYGIRNKIVRTTTDNGSNFLKAFRVYSADTNNNNNEVAGEDDAESGEEEEEEGVEEEVKFVKVSDILNENDGFEFELPKHQRCACHLLNLVSTVDADKACSADTYKRVYRSAFGKCHGLWNKCARSDKAAEAVEDACSIQLLRPNATRWNSLFMAVERLLRILKEKGEPALRTLCADLKVPMFSPVDITFLSEYATIMSPVAKAINVLQAETNVQLGWLLPTITTLTSKLEKAKLPLKHCRPLAEAVLAGLKQRFQDMSIDPELIAAAILLPKFRTTWTKDDATIRLGMDYIKEHLENPSLSGDVTRSSSSDDGDFFSALQSSRGDQDGTKQLDGYLALSADQMAVLKGFPAVCKLSVKLNTPLPASAACERLFSTAGLVFSPRRARLDSHNFENQLLLRLNRNFVKA